MKHRVSGKKLSRDINARKALLNNLASSLFINGSLKTTLAKSKFARPYVEKIITQAKKEKLSANRIIASHLNDNAFTKLTEQIAPGFKNRTGGYTKIIKLARRQGDSAPMARIEFLPYEIPSAERKKTSLKPARAKKLKRTKPPKKVAEKVSMTKKTKKTRNKK